MERSYVYFDVTITNIIKIKCTDHDTSVLQAFSTGKLLITYK